jgi:predicted hydrolase (HD superfamily)
VDELTGIVHAYALMRPEKMEGMSVKSFKKKFKDLRFAAKCDREVISRGFEMLGLDPGVVMQCCIDGMAAADQSEIGL